MALSPSPQIIAALRKRNLDIQQKLKDTQVRADRIREHLTSARTHLVVAGAEVAEIFGTDSLEHRAIAKILYELERPRG